MRTDLPSMIILIMIKNVSLFDSVNGHKVPIGS